MGTGVASGGKTVLKIIEVAIGIAVIVLMRRYDLQFGDGWTVAGDRFFVGVTTLGGMLIVTVPMLVTRMCSKHKLCHPLEPVYNFIGGFLYVTTGALLLDYYHGLFRSGDRQIAYTAGGLCIANGIIYIIDTFMDVSTDDGATPISSTDSDSDD